MHEKAAFVFWTTLILYIGTLCTVSYVGVYLTYIAIPLIVLSGLIMKLTKPKPETAESYSEARQFMKEASAASQEVGREISSGLSEMNKSLEQWNQKMERKRQRLAPAKAQYSAAVDQISEYSEAMIKAKTTEERDYFSKLFDEKTKECDLLQQQMESLERQLDLEESR